MYGINEAMGKSGISASLQHKIRKYFEFLYSQTASQSGSGGSQHQDFLQQLPEQLRIEAIQQANSEAISRIYPFTSLSADCQQQISLSMQQRFFYPSEMVFAEKTLTQTVFFVSTGAVQIVIKQKHVQKDKAKALAKNTEEEMVLKTLKVSHHRRQTS